MDQTAVANLHDRGARPAPQTGPDSRSLPDLRGRWLTNADEAEALRAQIEPLLIPATPDQIAFEVFALLSDYFVAETEQAVAQRSARRWIAHLREFPLWAIRDACDFWAGPNNHLCARKPAPGEIARRCSEEMKRLRGLPHKLKTWDRLGVSVPGYLKDEVGEDAPRISKERAAEILKESGFDAASRLRPGV